MRAGRYSKVRATTGHMAHQALQRRKRGVERLVPAVRLPAFECADRARPATAQQRDMLT